MIQDDFEKLKRFTEGQAEESEIEIAETLLSSGENNIALRNNLENEWNRMPETELPSDINNVRLLDRIHHEIRKNEALKKQSPLQKVLRTYVRIAAILLIPVFITGTLFIRHFENKVSALSENQTTTTIYAPLGARISFKLPDGTKGMLNSGSSLTYSIPFKKDRKVELEGEAWLEVSHDEAHPFEINAGSSQVKVLGTSFNISAYPSETYVEIVLVTGKLLFINKIRNETVSIDPSERLVFEGGQTIKTVTDPAKYNSWTEGKLVFRSDPMAEVARRIERWYNVEVKLADKKLEQYSFRATFEDDPLEEVLKLLSMTSPITYIITPRKPLEDGTWKKEVVTIYPK